MYSDYVLSTEADQKRHYREVKNRIDPRHAPKSLHPPIPVEKLEIPPTPAVPPVDKWPEQRAAAIYDDALHPALAMQVWREIVMNVARKRKVRFDDIISERRQVYIVEARHEAFYELREKTPASLARIGRWIGGRDHATVCAGIAKHKARMGLSGPQRPTVAGSKWSREVVDNIMLLRASHSTLRVAEMLNMSRGTVAGIVRREVGRIKMRSYYEE